MARATFGAGSCRDARAAFRGQRGVRSTSVGFMGGTQPRPTSRQVRTGLTGHVEVVQVEYDPALVSYEDLLEVFWDIHDPTAVNRQGPDIGTQYRSAIFFHTQEQQASATASRDRRARSGRYRRPIVTSIEPAAALWPVPSRPERRDRDAVAPCAD